MVDNLRKQLWTPPPGLLPEGEVARRKAGPIYNLAVVQALVRERSDRIYTVTDGCQEDLEKLEWDADDVAKLIGALVAQDYRNSEWCKGRGNMVIDADAYRIRYDSADQCRGDLRHPEYYVKFGFGNNDRRLIVCLFSCHLSRERNGP